MESKRVICHHCIIWNVFKTSFVFFISTGVTSFVYQYSKKEHNIFKVLYQIIALCFWSKEKQSGIFNYCKIILIKRNRQAERNYWDILARSIIQWYMPLPFCWEIGRNMRGSLILWILLIWKRYVCIWVTKMVPVTD